MTLTNELVRMANEVGEQSRRGGAPVLTMQSTREEVAAWLQWCDPNGCHTDEEARANECEPYDDEGVVMALGSMLSDT